MIKGKKLNLDQNNVITIGKFIFNKTCEAFPEQYDVYKGTKQVAYVRLRMGCLSVSVPDISGEDIYYKNFNEDPAKGYFDTQEERMKYLTKIAKILKEKKKCRIII